jgi:hypothetical protein
LSVSLLSPLLCFSDLFLFHVFFYFSAFLPNKH